MNAEEFRAWLEDHEACLAALRWLGTLPDPSLQAAWDACPRGDWMIWLHTHAGTEFEVLAPVVYNAVNRALRRAAIALDSAGIEHRLGIVVKDRASARAAEDAARAAAEVAEWDPLPVAGVAGADRAAQAAAMAAVAAHAAARASGVWAAGAAAEGAAGAAEFPPWPAKEAEQRMCADDCRELLEMPALTMKKESE